jgi:hypothetical protein
MTPEWRCRRGSCGHEWDEAPPSSEELVEEMRLEADRRESDLRREEEEGRQRERQLRLEEEERRETERQRVKKKNKRQCATLSIFGFIAGAAIGRALTDSFGGALIVAILLGGVVYYWEDLRS